MQQGTLFQTEKHRHYIDIYIYTMHIHIHAEKELHSSRRIYPPQRPKASQTVIP
jgi:hypothetical protein